jgi:hypothetical protein
MSNTNLTIIVQIKSIYGKEQIYPICNNARGFCALLNQKTLTRENIGNIKNLGYKIEIAQESIEL